ncbi:uncharacterized protein LOC106654951 [Trichogramma pretiosum]|uniref:uncharacterized protein LOC106654951 n=1 Tax=Trichogramma pretiosum TaxID=7493 RepID=UPI0006C9B0AF|nr:uncharacterized protein LOC106654951 [Trichogramma pretiosum]
MLQMFIHKIFFKIDAESMLRLKEYLLANNINDENFNCNDKNVLRQMLRATVRKFKFEDPTNDQVELFKVTIQRHPIDYLKVVNLYRVNHDLLSIACVEYVLYPEKTYEQYKSIYRCNDKKATEVYNKLCDKPEDYIVNRNIVKKARYFFNHEEYLGENEPWERIRSYLRSLRLDRDELTYIKDTSIQLIDGVL